MTQPRTVQIHRPELKRFCGNCKRQTGTIETRDFLADPKSQPDEHCDECASLKDANGDTGNVGKCHDCGEERPLREYEKDNLTGDAVLHIEICQDCYEGRTC